MAGQVGMGQRVALVGAVALAVGEILENGGNRSLLGIYRQPDTGSERGTVPQRYQCMLDNAHAVWKRRDNHGSTPIAHDCESGRCGQLAYTLTGSSPDIGSGDAAKHQVLGQHA